MWRHLLETFSMLLALCEGKPPVTGGFPSQRPARQSFDVFFDLNLNKRLSKQSRRWWLVDTPSVCRHCNVWLLTISPWTKRRSFSPGSCFRNMYLKNACLKWLTSFPGTSGLTSMSQTSAHFSAAYSESDRVNACKNRVLFTMFVVYSVRHKK